MVQAVFTEDTTDIRYNIYFCDMCRKLVNHCTILAVGIETGYNGRTELENPTETVKSMVVLRGS